LLSLVFVSVYVFFLFSNNFSSPPSSYGSSDSVAGSLLAANRFFVPYFCVKRYQIRFSCLRETRVCVGESKVWIAVTQAEEHTCKVRMLLTQETLGVDMHEHMWIVYFWCEF
jgi:hypothetical protein